MDDKLVAWARAVKARRARPGLPHLPPLWLFTDMRRLPDPRAAVRRLPRGVAGVVLRHDADPARATLARDLAQICRARRLALAVAGDWRLAARIGAGLHLREGRRDATVPRWLKALTASAHGVPGLLRARRSGAAVTFLSPAFPTASHPGAKVLGPLRWGLVARRLAATGALGGVDSNTVRRLPRAMCRAAGAIDALR